MTTSMTTRRDDRLVGALAPTTGSPVLFEVRRSRHGHTADVEASPVGDIAGAFRQRVRLTGVSEPAVLASLLAGLDDGPVNFDVSFGGDSHAATLAAVGAAVRLAIVDLATMTVVLEADDEPTGSAVAGVDDFAMLVMLAMVMTVAAVGAAIVVTTSTGDGSCDVEGDARPPQQGGGGPN
jgi:hypothetical protein